MSFSFVQKLHQYTATSGTAYSFGSNCTSGNLLVAFFSAHDNVTAPSISDSIGNTWQAMTYHSASGGTDVVAMQAWYCINKSTAANSVTMTFSNADAGFTVLEYSCTTGFPALASVLDTSDFRDQTINSGAGGNFNSASMVLSGTDLIVQGWGSETSGSPGTVTPNTVSSVAGNNRETDTGHWDVANDWIGVSGTQVFGWTCSNGLTSIAHWMMYTLAFLPGSGGGPTTDQIMSAMNQPTNSPIFDKKGLTAY